MNLDTSLFLTINHALSGHLATMFFSAVTYLGDGLVLAIVVLLPMYVFDRSNFRRHVLPMLVGVLVAAAVVNLLKIVVNRPRPEAFFEPLGIPVHLPLGTPPDRAFPSGHTQAAFGAATYLSCVYRAASPVFLILAALVGLSRIAVGVHYPLDVLAGAFFGASFSLVAFHWQKRRRP
jgi:undecaprenyl-diphosphatase